MNNDSIVLTWGNVIAIYAAVVSTVVGIIQIFKYRRETSNKLLINFYVGGQLPVFGNQLGEWQTVMNLHVINHSLTDRYIKSPGIFLNKGVKKTFSLINYKNPPSYPIKISPGEQFEQVYDALELKRGLRNENDKCTKMRIGLYDTLGKVHYSKWVKLSEIRDR